MCFLDLTQAFDRVRLVDIALLGPILLNVIIHKGVELEGRGGRWDYYL